MGQVLDLPHVDWSYLDAGAAAAAGVVDFTDFLCFFTLGVVDLVESVLGAVLGASCAAKPENASIERPRTAVIIVFMAV